MRGWLARVLLVVLGSVAGLALCEVALRLIGYAGDRERVAVAFDLKYGTVRKDSWILDFEIAPGADSTEINGQRVPLPKPAGETRILFVGDSGTEGTYVEQAQSFPMQLQEMLASEMSGSPVRVINAGVYGMTTLDELHFLRERLLPLEPDVVVVGLFMSNDINFNLGHQERRWVRGRSALVHFVYGRLLVLNAKHRWFRHDPAADESWVPREMTLIDEHGFHMLSYPQGEVATYVKDSSELIDHAFEVLAEAFRQFRRLGAENGFELRVVIIPAPSAIAGNLRLLHFRDIWAALEKWGFHLEPDQVDVHKPTRRVHEICDEFGVVCIDPTARLQQTGMGAFFPGDEHLTSIGHAVVARTLFDNRHLILAEP